MMASTWGKNKILKLIEVWGEDNIQEQLEGYHRNREVYMRIASRMSNCGFERSFEKSQEGISKNKRQARREWVRRYSGIILMQWIGF